MISILTEGVREKLKQRLQTSNKDQQLLIINLLSNKLEGIRFFFLENTMFNVYLKILRIKKRGILCIEY